MKKRKVYNNILFAGILIGVLFLLPVAAQDSIVKNTHKLLLGETPVKINVYEKKGSRITFFAPHYNEQTGLKIAKELAGKKGGRVVEIESLDENGKPARQIKFSFQGKSYSIDPNRIFTENGLQCSGFAPEPSKAIKDFSVNLLKIIFAPDSGEILRKDERFLVAVHNNSDIESKSLSAKEKDLTAYAFVRYSKLSDTGIGAFEAQAAGVYLSNLEMDEDNFVFLSTPEYISFFAEKGFNVVVQKSAAKLQSKNCGLDDGSLSVFAGQRNLPYINIEADATNGGFRQRQMVEAVYELLQKTNKSESQGLVAAAGNQNGETNK